MSRFADHYSSFGTGELEGSTDPVQCPTRPAKLVVFKAKHDNSGKVYIGFGDDITTPDESTNQTAGWPLAEGEETPALPIDNLNQIWYKCDADTDALHYVIYN